MPATVLGPRIARPYVESRVTLSDLGVAIPARVVGPLPCPAMWSWLPPARAATLRKATWVPPRAGPVVMIQADSVAILAPWQAVRFANTVSKAHDLGHELGPDVRLGQFRRDRLRDPYLRV